MVSAVADMIIGNGDIASVLPDRDDLLFFASGVSNSRCIDEKEYQREIDLLLDQPRAAHIVYFSSLGALDQDSRYYRHKRDMETMVKTNFPKNCVVRLGNISWGDNPHTLLNYLSAHPNAPIHNTYRHVISVEEFLYWMGRIPGRTVEMNCPGKFMKVKEIVDEYIKE